MKSLKLQGPSIKPWGMQSGKGKGTYKLRAVLVAQSVKNPPAIWETWVRSLTWEGPLEEGMATHCSILACRISKDSGAWWATAHGVTKSRSMREEEGLK